MNKPFVEVAEKIKLGKHISPKGMRRTFQDLARAASVSNLVTRAISGHETETMQAHYSSVAQDEIRSGLAQVVDLAGFREAMEAGCEAPDGVHDGVHADQRASDAG